MHENQSKRCQAIQKTFQQLQRKANSHNLMISVQVMTYTDTGPFFNVLYIDDEDHLEEDQAFLLTWPELKEHMKKI